MGSEASGRGRQVKQIRVLFAICHLPSHARSALALCSRCFDKINWHRIASSTRSAGSAGHSASGRHAPRLLRSARHVAGGPAALVSWLAVPTAAEDRLPRPSVRVAEREFWRADVRLFRKVGCLRLSHRRRSRSLSRGIGLGVVPYHSTWRSPPARRTRVHGDRGLRRPPKWRCFNQV